MSDKEKIKQEIERRIKEGSSKNDISEGALALNSLLDFIDSLPEEPVSKDLEEAADEFGIRQGVELKPFAIKFFTAGAHWQHGKDFDDLLQSEMKFPKEYYEKGKADAMKEMKEALQTEYEKGRFDMREEMMKDAIEGWCINDGSILNDIRTVETEKSNLKLDDKVKIIIVKN